jgi:phospholipid/cholesterol/gamma-HCH transport system ATP-binding protein
MGTMADPAKTKLDPIHLRVRGVRKSYGDKEVLRGVDVDAERGKINVIIGGSGAGKSVLMRQIVRLERPDAGEILFDGVDIARLGTIDLIPIRKRMGMVFQMSALFDSMDVFDNVAFMLREHTKMTAAEIRDRVMSRLTVLSVADAAKKMPSELSGGMKRRVAIARALVIEPELLIYDEPTTGLDPITSRAVDDLIVETGERAGVTSIVITHDMASVFRIGDVVNYLNKGLMELTASPANLRTTGNAAMREFLEASGITL